MTTKKTTVTITPAGKMSSDSWNKVLKGCLIAGGGALLTVLEGLIPGLDFGQWTVVVMAGNSILINLVKTWLSKQTVIA